MKKVLSLDCGGTNCRLALINENFEIEKILIKPTPVGDKEKWVNNIIEMIKEFPLENVVAIGAGIPGVCDRKNAKILFMENVKVTDVNFGDILMKNFRLPLFLRNDAEVACLGEAYNGAAKDYERAFFITISTGLGAALCVDKIVQDYLTEVGHTILTYENELFQYENIVSGINLPAFAKRYDVNVKNSKEFFDKVKEKDEKCLFVYDKWFDVLNKFVQLVKDSYSPEIICFTGGVMKSKDVFFNKLKELNKDIDIVECQYGENAGLIGAAVLALQGMKIIWFIFLLGIYYL